MADKPERPDSWFGNPHRRDRPKKVRVVPQFVMTGPVQNFHGQLRKQYYKDGEIPLSERLHRMGYSRKHLEKVLGCKGRQLHVLLTKPLLLKIQDVLSLSILLEEDFLDVLYEVAHDCKSHGMQPCKITRKTRLKRAMEDHPRTNSSSYKGKSLKD